MEGDIEDDDNLFDLGDDDEEEQQQEEGVPDGEMGHDPYDANDWDVLIQPEGQEEPEDLGEFGELLYGKYEDSDYIGDDDEDLYALMNKGLEEVDDILRKKGRLNVAPIQDLEGAEVLSANANSGAAPNTKSSHFSLVQEANAQGARGTGAQAASTLREIAGPSGTGPACVSHSIEQPTEQVAPLSQGAKEKHDNVNSQKMTNDTIPSRETAAVADDTNSPTRRRLPKREPPFIQAKGLSLTYAQAKLFGLAGATFPGSPSPPATSNRPVALSEVLQATKASTWSSCARGDRRGDGLRGCIKGERRPLNGTYSPSRMEHLARPVPGRGGVATANMSVANKGAGWDGTREDGGEASFTWRRSRRAEAAMRDPACGYDFVRDSGGFRDQKGFLGRVEAHSSYSRAKLETRRAEELYAARLDKLECPRCTNPQSHDEFSNKKLMCPGCDVAYWRPRTWNRSVWERRNEMRAVKSEERQARAEKEAEEEFIRRIPRQTRHAALLRQRVGQAGFIARMHHDLRRRRGRHTSMRNKVHTHESPDIDYDHQQHRATATTATTTEAACPASSPVGTTKTAAPRHRTAMEWTHGAVSEGGGGYHHARGTTSNEAPASTVVSKEARPPVPITTTSGNRKTHPSVLRNAHGPSPNLLAIPAGPCVTTDDCGDSRSDRDGMGKKGKIPRPLSAPKLPPEMMRSASFTKNSEGDRGTKYAYKVRETARS